MTSTKRFIRRLIRARAGASAIEYALLLGLMAIALVASITAVGNPTRAHFEAAEQSFPDELRQEDAGSEGEGG